MYTPQHLYRTEHGVNLVYQFKIASEEGHQSAFLV